MKFNKGFDILIHKFMPLTIAYTSLVSKIEPIVSKILKFPLAPRFQKCMYTTANTFSNTNVPGTMELNKQ